MSPKGRLWTAGIAAGVVGILIGAGAMWAFRPAAPATPDTGSAQQALNAAELDKKDAEIRELKTQLESLAASATSSVTETATTDPDKGPSRQFAFVTAVAGGSKPTIAADYAEFLTGDAAEAAAKAHGDESPANDYYIVNDNTKLRTLSIKPGITVKLTAHDDGTSDPEGYTVPFAQWASQYAAPTDENRSITEGPYWLTISNGVVTAIEEQYTP